MVNLSGQLAPPLRLVTMIFLAARSSLRKNTAESVTELTGGEFRRFHEGKDLKAGLFAVSNDVPNDYVLSFRPTNLAPGLHALQVVARNPLMSAEHFVRCRSQDGKIWQPDFSDPLYMQRANSTSAATP